MILKLGSFLRLSAATAILAALTLSTASATPVYGTDVDSSELPTGSRSVAGGGLTNVDPDWTDVILSWNITLDGGIYSYEYTLSGVNRPATSHFVVDLSPGCNDASCVWDARLNGNLINTNKVEFGTFDGISGVKFDVGGEGDLVYSFLSNRVPVYGNVAVKGGQNLMTNTGIDNPESTYIFQFVAVPDSVVAQVPEPSSIFLMAPLGLLGLYIRRRRSA